MNPAAYLVDYELAERTGVLQVKYRIPYSDIDDLPEEEKKHRDILTKIYTSNTIERYFSETRDYKVAETVEEPALSMDMKPADAFALAMKKEEEAMKQYSEMADLCDDEEKRQVFLDLAAMERDHKLKMETAFTDIGYPEVW